MFGVHVPLKKIVLVTGVKILLSINWIVKIEHVLVSRMLFLCLLFQSMVEKVCKSHNNNKNQKNDFLKFVL